MVASQPQPLPLGDQVPTADQRLVMYRVPWENFEAQLALRGDAPIPRISYLKGALELMTPSRDHERLKSYIGCLIEAYALHAGVDLSPYGAWTLRREAREAGAEPDECYIIGSDQSADRPDLVIEVIWTSGGIDKLEIYRRLDIPEVWFWRQGRIEIFVRRGDAMGPSTTSPGLPGLDVAQLASFLDEPTALQAVRAFRATLD